LEAASERILAWFDDDELGDCPQCGQRHLLPTGKARLGQICATCGVIPPAAESATPTSP
jgi:hypothetical protein